MNRFFLFLIFLIVGFAGGFGAAKWKSFEFLAENFSKVPKNMQTEGFRATSYPQQNLPFVIVIIGRNNGAYLEKTLQSIFFQNYENFRILYVDDASDDGSFDLAQELINA